MKKHRYSAILNLIIPAILINLVTGSVYCWSLLSAAVIGQFLCSKVAANLSFSLAIFFLGMSGAFFGKIAEKNPKLMFIISAATFVGGLFVASIACATGQLWLLWLGYGVLMGIGCGTAYVSCPKSLSVWFRHNPGKGASIGILSFGFAKVFGTMLIQFLLTKFTITITFVIMGCIYAIPMIIAIMLFKKIPFKLKDKIKPTSIKEAIFTKKYFAIWFMFFANITCGLAFISQEAPILVTFGLGVLAVSVISSLSAAFNSLGRFSFAALSDWKGREFTYYVCAILAIIACLLNFTNVGLIFVISLMIINSVYGGNFSALPPLITKHYGINKTSTMHGITLSGWGCAGFAHLFLVAYLPYNVLLAVLAIIYLLSFIAVKKFVDSPA